MYGGAINQSTMHLVQPATYGGASYYSTMHLVQLVQPAMYEVQPGLLSKVEFGILPRQPPPQVKQAQLSAQHSLG